MNNFASYLLSIICLKVLIHGIIIAPGSVSLNARIGPEGARKPTISILRHEELLGKLS